MDDTPTTNRISPAEARRRMRQHAKEWASLRGTARTTIPVRCQMLEHLLHACYYRSLAQRAATLEAA